jgi:hypothetical protein
MNDALARIRERMRQNREARADDLWFPGPFRPTTAARTNAPIREGTQVFDTVTGLEGEVLGGTRENVVVSTPRR